MLTEPKTYNGPDATTIVPAARPLRSRCLRDYKQTRPVHRDRGAICIDRGSWIRRRKSVKLAVQCLGDSLFCTRRSQKNVQRMKILLDLRVILIPTDAANREDHR